MHGNYFLNYFVTSVTTILNFNPPAPSRQGQIIRLFQMLLKQWVSLKRNTERVTRQRSGKSWQALSRNWCKHGNTNLKVQPNYYKDKMAEVPIWGVTVSNLILQLANFSVKWQTVHLQALLVMWSESQSIRPCHHSRTNTWRTGVSPFHHCFL